MTDAGGHVDYMLLQRNLIYTGITRAKRLPVLIGQTQALGIAVRNDQSKSVSGTPEQPNDQILRAVNCESGSPGY